MEGSLLGEADADVQADRDTLTQKNIEWIRTSDDVRHPSLAQRSAPATASLAVRSWRARLLSSELSARSV
jgi:hypothetical protein